MQTCAGGVPFTDQQGVFLRLADGEVTPFSASLLKARYVPGFFFVSVSYPNGAAAPFSDPVSSSAQK